MTRGPRSRAARFVRPGLLALGVLAAAVAPAGAGGLEGWLAAEDPVERCAIIAVLNGEHPGRADEGARLYRAGVGSEVWLTLDPRSGSGNGDDAGTRSNGARLVSRGVPANAVRILPGQAVGTRAELEIIAAALRQRALGCAVVVTSPLHGRRVKLTWRVAVGESPRAVIRHARSAGYNGWRVELRELGLSLLALIGLPR